jgi:hypothetical protein
MAERADLTVSVGWSQDDLSFAAVLLRDGKPWYLNGALVGMGSTREAALTDLLGIARHLVMHGENFLLPGLLPLADREWLFSLLDSGPSDDEMYAALRTAREAGG